MNGDLEVVQLSLWELCEGNLEGGFPCQGPWSKGRKGSGQRYLSIFTGAPLWYLEVGSSTRDFDRWMLETKGMGHLSLKRLNAEGLKGRLLYWGTWVMNGGLWRQASLFMGAQLGKPGVGTSTRNFERWLKGLPAGYPGG